VCAVFNIAYLFIKLVNVKKRKYVIELFQLIFGTESNLWGKNDCERKNLKFEFPTK